MVVEEERGAGSLGEQSALSKVVSQAARKCWRMESLAVVTFGTLVAGRKLQAKGVEDGGHSWTAARASRLPRGMRREWEKVGVWDGDGGALGGLAERDCLKSLLPKDDSSRGGSGSDGRRELEAQSSSRTL